MRLLLDTHVALWWVLGDERLIDRVRLAIEDDDNDVFVSVASIWEISIKNARPKGLPGDMLISGEEALAEFKRAGVDLLPIRPAHAARAGEMPPIHRDPFDRMLVAQAIMETLMLVTSDRTLLKYPVSIMAA